MRDRWPLAARIGIAQYGSPGFRGRRHFQMSITLAFIGVAPLRRDLPRSYSITFNDADE